MRPIFGWVMAGGLVLGLASVASAQNSMAGFGGYPAGITTGSSSGANWSGYYGLNPGGYPLTSYNQPYSFYGSNYVIPQTGGSNPGYYSYQPGVTQYPRYANPGYYAPGPSGAMAPGTTYYTPGTATYGTYRAPNTVTYGAPMGGYSTYVAPSYRGYAMPRGGLLRRWVR